MESAKRGLVPYFDNLLILYCLVIWDYKAYIVYVTLSIESCLNLLRRSWDVLFFLGLSRLYKIQSRPIWVVTHLKQNTSIA